MLSQPGTPIDGLLDTTAWPSLGKKSSVLSEELRISDGQLVISATPSKQCYPHFTQEKTEFNVRAGIQMQMCLTPKPRLFPSTTLNRTGKEKEIST